MDAIQNQTDVLCVYVAVGQKNSTVAEYFMIKGEATCTVYDDLTSNVGISVSRVGSAAQPTDQ